MTKGYTTPDIPNEAQSPMHYMQVRSMESNGVDPALIYAFRKTDLPGYSPSGCGLLSAAERKSWDDAIQEFQAANPQHVIARTVDGLR